MKTELEVKEKLNAIYQKRLKSRYKKHLTRYFKNCSNYIPHEDGTGSCKFAVAKKKFVSCDQEKCSSCPDYSSSFKTKADVEVYFRELIRNVDLCIQHEPKIAMLMWVLNDSGKKKLQEEVSLWQKFVKGLKSLLRMN